MIDQLWQGFLDLFTYTEGIPMLFNSGQFLALFALFIIGYALLFKNTNARLVYVIGFSLFFYFKNAGGYLLVLLFSIITDWLLAFAVHKEEEPWRRKALLVISLACNLGLLVYFKYTNFLLSGVAMLQGQPFDALEIFLPIGISFYTFQTISYIVDVYRKEIEPTKSLLDYTFYMTFFPHLVAGPIVRARFFLPQVRQALHLTQTQAGAAIFLIIKGLIKKAVVADYLSQYVDLVFDNPSGFSGFEVLMAVYGYAMQIYCDFSGYSDMAIGIARLLGYELGDNFASPYQSISITDFWRRWHISLSQWLRDYVYIPLGGNRRGEGRTYLHLAVIMLLGGLWHGASWKFIFWGGMHGSGLAVHKLFSKALGKTVDHKLSTNRWAILASGIVTFHFVAALWIFFRASDFQVAMEVLQRSVQIDWAYFMPFIQTRGTWMAILVLAFAVHWFPKAWKEAVAEFFSKLPILAQALGLLISIQLTLQFASESVQPFIYFQF